MKKIILFAVATAVAMAVAAPAFATGANGAGRAYGEHVATHAQEMGGFTGTMNPGMHQGFVGGM